MEQNEKAPQRYSELRDPKLPRIHCQIFASPDAALLRPSPLPEPPKEL